MNMSEEEENTTSSKRSLRIRRPRTVEEDESAQVHSKKKRGSKRKAEVNIESLYCQEKVKDVCPASLETIFESPQKSKGGRGRGNKHRENVGQLAIESQVMSGKKLRRCCAFTNYYYPTKQKVKLRKARAKRLKQVSGVRIPQGAISDAELQAALSVLSDEEEQNQTISKDMSLNHSSFYVGNIIRPDVEDSLICEVIKNISSLQMITEHDDQKEVLPSYLMEGTDNPLLFTEEGENRQPVVSDKKKTRRRSQKFSGSLLPRSAILEEDEEKPDAHSLGTSEMDEMAELNDTPKRRNSLNDREVVKKAKFSELRQKRKSESGSQQCYKKRGNLKDELRLNHAGETDQQECGFVQDIKSTNIEQGSKIQEELINLSCLQVYKMNDRSFKKKRNKRRVSGTLLPIYRAIMEYPSSEESFEGQNVSPNDSCNNALIISPPETTGSSIQLLPKSASSPIDTCSQMAALSLQVDPKANISQLESPLRSSVSKKSLRRSLRLSRANDLDIPSELTTEMNCDIFKNYEIVHGLDAHTEVYNGGNLICEQPKLSLDNKDKNNDELIPIFQSEGVSNKSHCSNTPSKTFDNAPDNSDRTEYHLTIDHHAENLKVTDCERSLSADLKDTVSSCDNICKKSVSELSDIKKESRNFEFFDEGEIVDSPILTGMIANKASIRLGKVMRNLQSSELSPIIVRELESFKS